ncbi:MAG: molybdopterin-dependent oxidoreductase [Acidimicrobiaceae bacterium]|nr:molybdopterin-dependent oxidoreductase [Acidimicrobiaceae bacterium]
MATPDGTPGSGSSDARRSLASSLSGGLAGTAGAAVGLGFGELMEGAFESIPSLVVAVSELLSDYTPGDVVRFSIANFGASQKTLLTVGIVIGSLAVGGLLGVFAARKQPRATISGFAVFGLIAGWCAARNPLSPVLGSWLVGLTAAAAACATTLLLARLAASPRIAAAAAGDSLRSSGQAAELGREESLQLQQQPPPSGADSALAAAASSPSDASPDGQSQQQTSPSSTDPALMAAASSPSDASLQQPPPSSTGAPSDSSDSSDTSVGRQLPLSSTDPAYSADPVAATNPTTPDQAPQQQPPPSSSPPGTEPSTEPVTTASTGSRRAFFAYAGGAGAAALAMVGLGRALRGQSAAEQFLETNTLRPAAAPTTTAAATSTTAAPAAATSTIAIADTAPATTAAPTAAVAEQLAALRTLDSEVTGISSYVTPNDRFYRIDTAFGRVPQIDPAGWRLRFTGMVDNPYELTFDEIQAMDLSDHVITLSCVSNEVGGNLVGNAVWTGIPLSVLLDRAGVQPGADQVVGRSVDDWTAGFPTPVVYDGRNAILAIGMNNEFLPTDHGFPARLVVAGLYGYVSAVKWLDEIHLTTWDGFDGYWVPRGWSKEGPMKTQSRIDVPGGGDTLRAGETVPIAGIAWAPTRGIERVEVNIDEEGWQTCELGEALGDESWVQWHHAWTPAEGRHRIQVRATDGDGATQSSRQVSPAPNGAEGWHTVNVNVAA